MKNISLKMQVIITFIIILLGTLALLAAKNISSVKDEQKLLENKVKLCESVQGKYDKETNKCKTDKGDYDMVNLAQ